MHDSLELLRNIRAPGTAPERMPGRSASALAAESDEDACPAFGFLRGLRERSLSIELRYRNGNSEAFPYSWLGPA